MPIFEFLCQDCKKVFERMVSNAEKENIKCPECGSANIKQLLSLFNTGSHSRDMGDCCEGNCCSCCYRN